jgi:PIN domain
MILLDTNVVSEAMKPEPHPVRDWLDAQAAETVFLFSVTIAELLFGIGEPHKDSAHHRHKGRYHLPRFCATVASRQKTLMPTLSLHQDSGPTFFHPTGPAGSSLTPRATIRSAPSARGRCSFRASSGGAVIQVSTSSGVVKIHATLRRITHGLGTARSRAYCDRHSDAGARAPPTSCCH